MRSHPCGITRPEPSIPEPVSRTCLPASAILFWTSLTVLLSACSSIDIAAGYAEKNEIAIQRQQAGQARPKVANQQVYLDMIREMQERSLYFASLAHIDAYLNTYESTPELQRLRADALRATGQPEAAQAQYRALLTTTQAAAALHGLGLLAGQRGDFRAAIADFRAAIAKEPINAAMLSDLGYALMQDGDRRAARLPLMQAMELMPDNRKIASNLALYLLLSDERDKADAVMAHAGFSDDARAEIARQADKLGGRDHSPSVTDGAAAPKPTAPAAMVPVTPGREANVGPGSGTAPSRNGRKSDRTTGVDIQGLNDTAGHGYLRTMLQRFRESP